MNANLRLHDLSVPQFRPSARTNAQRTFTDCLSIHSSPQIRPGKLLDVVHHAVQVPLRIDLGVASMIQASQPLVVPDVGKHRLHSSDALSP